MLRASAAMSQIATRPQAPAVGRPCCAPALPSSATRRAARLLPRFKDGRAPDPPENEPLLAPSDQPFNQQQARQGQGATQMQSAASDYGATVRDYSDSVKPTTSSQPFTAGSAADYTASGFDSMGQNPEFTFERISAGVREAWINTPNKPLVALYAGAAVLFISVSGNIIDAVDRVPLVPAVLKLVGTVYSANFFWRYLLFKRGREQLRADVRGFTEQLQANADELQAVAGDAAQDVKNQAKKVQAKTQHKQSEIDSAVRDTVSEYRRQANEDGEPRGSSPQQPWEGMETTPQGMESVVKGEVGRPNETQPVRGKVAQGGAAGEGAGVADLE